MSETMKCAVLVGEERLEIRQVPVPEPQKDEALIRVRAVGICGSDVTYFQGFLQSDTSYPFVLGHEFAGEVAALGPGVSGVEVGARVACAPDLPCGRCEWCRKGEVNVCPNVRFAASHGVPGCLSEYYVVHASQVYPIGDSVDFAEAALFEPVSIGLHVVENLVRPAGGEGYAVLGANVTGLSILFAARQNGASAVYVSELVPERLEAARKLGADATCDARQEDFVEFVRQRTRGRGVDVVAEATGAVSAIQQVFHLAAIHGRAVILGIPHADTLEIDLTAARRRELTVVAGRRSVNKYDRALDFIQSGKLDTSVLITHRFPLDEAQQAFECARDCRDGVIKAMVLP